LFGCSSAVGLVAAVLLPAMIWFGCATSKVSIVGPEPTVKQLSSHEGDLMEERMNDLERAVVEKLLDGEHPALPMLREQASKAGIVDRKNTGVGVFTKFRVPLDVGRADNTNPRASIGDIEASIPGLRHGAGFVLFLRDGYIDTLEGFTYDEPWPSSTEGFSLSYRGGGNRDWSLLGPG